MKKLTAGASIVLTASLMLGACAKHDDTSNVTITNETVVNETVDPGVVTDNLASPDASINGADATANDSAGGNTL